MDKHCKNCRFKKQDTKTDISRMAVGIAIFGFPMPPVTEYVDVCSNHRSYCYGDEVNSYDHCSYFDSKY